MSYTSFSIVLAIYVIGIPFTYGIFNPNQDSRQEYAGPAIMAAIWWPVILFFILPFWLLMNLGSMIGKRYE